MEATASRNAPDANCVFEVPALDSLLVRSPKLVIPAPASGGWNYADGRRPPPNHAATLPTGAPNCLAGKVFVTTGVLPTLDRDQVKAIATKHGGRCTGAVSGKTTHLIAGDVLDDGRPVAESGKYKKAVTLGTAIISEAEFRAMIR